MRTLLFIIAVAVVIMIARRLLAKPRAEPRQRLKDEHMVQCARCGVYIPEPEALLRGDRFYCSQAHLDADLHN